MRRSIIVTAVLAFSTTVALHAFAGGDRCEKPKNSAANSSGASCSAKSNAKTASHEDGCSSSCGMRGAKTSAKAVVSQPGAKRGDVTRCPVNGEIFTVDAKTPHVRVGKGDYVACCNECAAKLKREPKRYLKA